MFSLGETVGGFLGDNQSIDKGLTAQADATQQANAKLDQIYGQQRSDLAPWMTAGTTALSGMQNPDFQRDFSMSDFQQDPGYNFRLQEGQKALERSAAARGAVQSGATLKALSQYNQDFASNEYNNAYNRFNNDRNLRFGRLSSVAGMGENATGVGVNAAGSYGSMYGQNLMGMGNAYAAGGIARANANNQMMGSLLSGAGKAGMMALA